MRRATYRGDNPDIIGEDGNTVLYNITVDGSSGRFYPDSNPNQGYIVYRDELIFHEDADTPYDEEFDPEIKRYIDTHELMPDSVMEYDDTDDHYYGYDENFPPDFYEPDYDF